MLNPVVAPQLRWKTTTFRVPIGDLNSLKASFPQRSGQPLKRAAAAEAIAHAERMLASSHEALGTLGGPTMGRLGCYVRRLC